MTVKPIATKKYLRWNKANSFEERIIQHKDWVLFGAPEVEEGQATPPDTLFGEVNNWTVPVTAIPLDEAQLAQFVAVEGKFTVVEK